MYPLLSRYDMPNYQCACVAIIVFNRKEILLKVKKRVQKRMRLPYKERKKKKKTKFDS